ncbi:hypothetical protein FS837_011565 [Tulasnella sp. UAMH 9824]|nr:hypothetical protein FS837_011565 [Tulasnella sp. UAMH 9824]
MKSHKPKPHRFGDHSAWIAFLSVFRWKSLAARTFKAQETPSKIAFLPYEILLAIIECLDERSVACMLRTCRFLRNLAEPILYRHIRVHHDPEDEVPNINPIKPHLLHRTLVGRPDLLPIVLSYHGPLFPDREISFDAYPSKRRKALRRKIKTITRQNDLISDEYLEKLKIISNGTINIQELHFMQRSIFYPTQVLRPFDAPHSKMINLKSLVLDVFGSLPELVPILRTLPWLKHLELPQLRGEIQLDETDLLELESLKAEIRLAAGIVPGRPIKKLELMRFWSAEEDPLWPRLALSACGITDAWLDSCLGSSDFAFSYLVKCRTGSRLPDITPDDLVQCWTAP